MLALLFRLKTSRWGLLLFIVLLSSCGPINGGASGSGGGVTEEGRVYALVHEEAAVARVAQAARALGYTPETAQQLTALGLWMVPVDLPSPVTGSEAIQAIEASVPEATVGVNHAYRLQVTGPAHGSLMNFANTLIAWPNEPCRARRKIGLIDGPVDASIGALKTVDVRAARFVGTDNPEAARHGTEVAAILSDPTRLQNVELYSANVVASDPTGDPVAGAAEMVQALDWLASSDVKIVSVSLAGPYNKLLDLAVKAASARGVQIVAAVGNSGPSAAPQFPAAFPDVVAVTAVDARERIFRSAGRGTHVDIAAAGVDVFVPTGANGRFVSGTSVATPMVAASLAAQDRLDPKALFAAARDLGPRGKDTVFGHGLLQAASVCGG